MNIDLISILANLNKKIEIRDELTSPEKLAAGDGSQLWAGHNDANRTEESDLHDWIPLGMKALPGQLSINTYSDKHVLVLVRDIDNSFRITKMQDGKWIPWYKPEGLSEELCNIDVGQFQLARFGRDDAAVVFARGKDNQIWHYWETDNGLFTQPWRFSSIGGESLTDFYVTDRCYGGMEVYNYDAKGQLWHCWTMDWQNDEWSDWSPLGGECAQDMIVKNNTEGFPQVFVKDAINSVWAVRHLSHDPWWTEWKPLNGIIKGKLAAVNNTEGGMDLFGTGFDGKIYTCGKKMLDGPWSKWICMNGSSKDIANVLKDKKGNTCICYLGTDSKAWMLSGDKFTDLGGKFIHIWAESEVDGSIVIVAQTPDNSLYYKVV